jgi:hypothetical protein
MKKVNLLSRAEMRKVMGGMESVEPIDGGGGKGYKCCYTNPDGCSVCDTNATPTNATCPKNSAGSQGVLTAC